MSEFVIRSANLRDLAVNADVGLRRGRLYRGGRLSELEGADRLVLDRLSLASVIDLRRPSEVEAYPPPPELVDRWHNISTSVDDNEFAVIANELGRAVVVENPEVRVEDYFRGIVRDGLDRYRPVFSLIMDPINHPLLFHCTAGKDRTGFVAAALLGMLGASDEAILADFEITNEARRSVIDQARLKLVDSGAANPAAALRMLEALMVAQPRFMAGLLDEVAVNGGWDEVRRGGLGIDDAAFETFRVCVSSNG
ncbi:MAG: tyrosine-protein phosphatase [Acidobacteria bacterium]|nr:tyrosine-protein phosphatase [Acidobacteriota bacterium]